MDDDLFSGPLRTVRLSIGGRCRSVEERLADERMYTERYSKGLDLWTGKPLKEKTDVEESVSVLELNQKSVFDEEGWASRLLLNRSLPNVSQLQSRREDPPASSEGTPQNPSRFYRGVSIAPLSAGSELSELPV